MTERPIYTLTTLLQKELAKERPDGQIIIKNLKGVDIFIDFSLNGEYQRPQMKNPPWVSPDGVTGHHQPLIKFANLVDCNIDFGDQVVSFSHGRGVTITKCKECKFDNIKVYGCRSAGVSVLDSSDLIIERPTTLYTSNYLQEKIDLSINNIAGSINLKRCHDVIITRPTSITHMGNGITVTECQNVKFYSGLCIDVNGAQFYANASPDTKFYNCASIGYDDTGNAFVVNSEEENEGESDNFEMFKCVSLGKVSGFNLWNNEGKTGVKLSNIVLEGNRLFGHRDSVIRGENQLETPIEYIDHIQEKGTDKLGDVFEMVTQFMDGLDNYISKSIRKTYRPFDVYSLSEILGGVFELHRSIMEEVFKVYPLVGEPEPKPEPKPEPEPSSIELTSREVRIIKRALSILNDKFS